jgi:deoxyhypusine synthase
LDTLRISDDCDRPGHPPEKGSSDLVKTISEGLKLSKKGLVGAAVKNAVPVFVPALTDSEVGLWLFEAWAGNGVVRSYSPMVDLRQYATLLLGADKLAIISVGGGFRETGLNR